jgi:photosystem II CP47 chlorophyll apoprotein
LLCAPVHRTPRVCIFLHQVVAISTGSTSFWTFETVAASHIILSGLLILAACWHWTYWNLTLFRSTRTGKLDLDLLRIFGIHLLLASSLCFGFGSLHLTADLPFSGPGMWVSDADGTLGGPRQIGPITELTPAVLNPFRDNDTTSSRSLMPELDP